MSDGIAPAIVDGIGWCNDECQCSYCMDKGLSFTLGAVCIFWLKERVQEFNRLRGELEVLEEGLPELFRAAQAVSERPTQVDRIKRLNISLSETIDVVLEIENRQEHPKTFWEEQAESPLPFPQDKQDAPERIAELEEVVSNLQFCMDRDLERASQRKEELDAFREKIRAWEWWVDVGRLTLDLRRGYYAEKLGLIIGAGPNNAKNDWVVEPSDYHVRVLEASKGQTPYKSSTSAVLAAFKEEACPEPTPES